MLCWQILVCKFDTPNVLTLCFVHIPLHFTLGTSRDGPTSMSFLSSISHLNIGISLLRNVPLEMHPFQTFHIIQMKARRDMLLGRQSIIYVPNLSAIMFVAARASS